MIHSSAVVQIPNVIVGIYFTYILYYGLQNQKVRTFLYEVFCCVDEFLKNRDFPNDWNFDDEPELELEAEAEDKAVPSPEKKLLRYEDKYLDQYTKLESVNLTKERLDGLKNTMIMESTPIGNVIMFYDNQTENFVYYSDLTMPYRYLEVIGRKYVITFNCKNIFIDMNEEIKTAEDKKIKHTKASLEVLESNKKESDSTKKDVFAKFKTYNNNVTKEVVAAPSKNSGTADIKKDNDNSILKEKANRYRSEGKLANLKFVQQVDKTQIDKRLAVSWRDFKTSSLSK
jgi:hypothetical protein